MYSILCNCCDFSQIERQIWRDCHDKLFKWYVLFENNVLEATHAQLKISLHKISCVKWSSTWIHMKADFQSSMHNLQKTVFKWNVSFGKFIVATVAQNGIRRLRLCLNKYNHKNLYSKQLNLLNQFLKAEPHSFKVS